MNVLEPILQLGGDFWFGDSFPRVVMINWNFKMTANTEKNCHWSDNAC